MAHVRHQLTCMDMWQKLPLKENACQPTQRSQSISNCVPSLDSAPRRKKSQSDKMATAVAIPAARNLLVLLAIRKFFNCSNTVYCITGLMTRTNAGPMPRQNAEAPSLAKMHLTVSVKPSFLVAVGECDGSWSVRTAWEVWMTHIGLLMIVVAEPGAEIQPSPTTSGRHLTGDEAS
jgi:hypothetical protein